MDGWNIDDDDDDESWPVVDDCVSIVGKQKGVKWKREDEVDCPGILILLVAVGPVENIDGLRAVGIWCDCCCCCCCCCWWWTVAIFRQRARRLENHTYWFLFNIFILFINYLIITWTRASLRPVRLDNSSLACTSG